MARAGKRRWRLGIKGEPTPGYTVEHVKKYLEGRIDIREFWEPFPDILEFYHSYPIFAAVIDAYQLCRDLGKCGP